MIYGGVRKVSFKDSSIYQDMISLVRIPSVTTAGSGEIKMAEAISEMLSSIPYFTKHPEDLQVLPCAGDPYNRLIVFAVVRADPSTEKTVILTGHMDVVSTEVCGSLSDIAFDPEEYTRRILEIDIPADARVDLDSSEWLFGRGVADMKSGVACCIDQIKKAAEDPSNMDTNLAVLFVPDEENNSAGMLGAVSYLKDLSENGMDFIACIDTEPSMPDHGESYPTAYLGTVGKLNSFFYFQGLRSHVGEYYKGMSAGLISSCINLELDGNPEFSDRYEDYYSPPYGCLKMRDLREEYSATILDQGTHIYSYLTVSKKPGDIVKELKSVARESLDKAIDIYRSRCERFSEISGSEVNPVDLSPNVYSYSELETIARDKCDINPGTFIQDIFLENDGKDERDKALKVVTKLVKLCALKPPFVIYGFLPPWYPHKVNTRTGKGDNVILNAVEKLLKHADQEYSTRVKIRSFFEGVCDLSYCGYRGTAADISSMGNNTPGWGVMYKFPSEELTEIDIPIINFGPVGKDLHKNTERVHLPFLINTYPQLLSHLIKSIDR